MEGHVKSDELLEACEGNQQPSSSKSENKIEEKVQRLTVEDSDTNKTDKSVGQPIILYNFGTNDKGELIKIY